MYILVEMKIVNPNGAEEADSTCTSFRLLFMHSSNNQEPCAIRVNINNKNSLKGTNLDGSFCCCFLIFKISTEGCETDWHRKNDRRIVLCRDGV